MRKIIFSIISSIMAPKRSVKRETILQFLFLLAAGLILIPPSLLHSMRMGLDPSWMISINLAVTDDRIFGTDYIFSYGPLGFLWTRIGTGLSRFGFASYDIWVWVQWMGFFVWVVRERKMVYGGLLLVALFFCPPFMWLLLGFVAVLFVGLSTGSILALAVSGVSALLCVFIKANYGFILPLMWVAALLAAWLSGKCRGRWAIALAAGWGVLVLVAARLLHVALVPYLSAGAHLIAGYSEAMFIPIDPLDGRILLAWGILLAYAGISLWDLRSLFRDFRQALLFGLTGLLLFSMFKNGFLRADAPHIQIFYSSCPLAIGVLALFIPRRPARALLVLMGIALLVGQGNPATRLIHLPHPSVSSLWPESYLAELFHADLAERKCVLTPEQRATRPIPADVLADLWGERFDSMSVDIQMIQANNLPYSPRPVPQSYQACNAVLDGINAAHFASDAAPGIIIYQSKTIDGRHPFWDESITKRELLARYECPFDAATLFDEDYYTRRYPDIEEALKNGEIPGARWHYDQAGRFEGRIPGFYYLKQRAQPLVVTYAREGTEELRFNVPYPVESTEDLLYLEADVKPTLWGRIRSLIFQPASIGVTLLYKNGQRETFRACRPILRTGVLLNRKVSDNEDAVTFYHTQGQGNLSVTKVMFTTPHPACYRPVIPSGIWKLRISKNEDALK